MIFIGVISEHQRFEILKKNILTDENKYHITLININKKSIENLKTVKFNTIAIIDALEKIEDKSKNIEDMCKNMQYLIINSDIEINSPIFSNIKANIITYGLNQKSTVTFSSITDETLLVSVQREFADINNRLIEQGEYDIKVEQPEKKNLHEILAQFIIQKVYNLM